MTLYSVEAAGCDDVTRITIDLTDEEAAVIGRIADAITDASDYGCMPTLAIAKATG